jgi:hypothetical protein
MANPAKGEVALPAGDQTYTLKLGTNALAELTGMLSIGLAEVQSALSAGRVDVIRAVMWAALRKHHSLNLMEVGDLIDDVGFDAALEAVGNALKLAFPEAAASEENPQPAA